MTAPTDARLSERLGAAFPGFELPAELLRIAEVAVTIDDAIPFHAWDVAKASGIDEELLSKVGSVLYRPGDTAFLRFVCEANGWELGEPVEVPELDQVPDEVPEEYELSPDELAALEALEASPVPEPSPEPAKAVAAPTAPVKDVPAWEWDGAKPLESAREWETAMLSCKHIGPAVKNVGSLYRAVGHMTSGEGYVGVEYATTVLGSNERNFKNKRGELRDAGWITDTGRDTGGRYKLPIYSFTMGHCGCRAPKLGE